VQEIQAELNRIAETGNPYPHLSKLTGQWAGLYKIRFGIYRVRVEVDEENKRLVILKIGPRQNFYNN
jgi:mRNA-degrading endonuclease RelE of RelBE toxin-antitoxin system